MKAYKVFNSDWTCIDFQYEVGKTYKLLNDNNNLLSPIKCKRGFHACKKLNQCFNYYDFNPLNKVAIVEVSGKIFSDDDKLVCNIITIVEELSWEKVLTLVNTGIGNTGLNNSGDNNSGNRNSGDSNSGHENSGNKNAGNGNSGHGNSGNNNTGHGNSGYKNFGDRNTGHWNSGNWNSGDNNSGNKNSGDWNLGHRNSGNNNSGTWNSGHSNSGSHNSGYKNTGHSNSGDRNSGDSNTGDWNSCNLETGHFNSISPTMINIFNVPTDIKVWINSKKPAFIYNTELNIWVDFIDMSDDEKIDNPNANTNGGYRKQFSYKEAWRNAFDNRNEDDLELLKALPNFNAVVFEEISGININEIDKQ